MFPPVTVSSLTTPEMSFAPESVRSIVSVSDTVYVVSVSTPGVAGTKFVPSKVRTCPLVGATVVVSTSVKSSEESGATKIPPSVPSEARLLPLPESNRMSKVGSAAVPAVVTPSAVPSVVTTTESTPAAAAGTNRPLAFATSALPGVTASTITSEVMTVPVSVMSTVSVSSTVYVVSVSTTVGTKSPFGPDTKALLAVTESTITTAEMSFAPDNVRSTLSESDTV